MKEQFNIRDFLEERNFSDEAIREVMNKPIFVMYSYYFIRDILNERKLLIDLIREMKAKNLKINWNAILYNKMGWYSKEEQEQMIKEFNLVKYPSSFGLSWEER